MKIEKLTENQIRITLNTDDLSKNSINIHSFMSNSIESQDLFCKILDKAEKEIGFTTDNYKLMVEAFLIPENNFILTITRLKREIKEPKIKLEAKRKSTKLDSELLIYMFKSFDDFCEFTNYLKINFQNFLDKLRKSKLFKYNSNYYFLFRNTNLNVSEIKQLHCILLEFSEFVHNSNLFERKLNEYGYLIASGNAINRIR